MAFESGHLFGKSTGFIGNGFGGQIAKQSFEFRIVRFFKRVSSLPDILSSAMFVLLWTSYYTRFLFVRHLFSIGFGQFQIFPRNHRFPPDFIMRKTTVFFCFCFLRFFLVFSVPTDIMTEGV